MNVHSVTTLCFRSSPLPEALDAAVAAGFSAVELCAVKGFLEHVDPDDASPEAVERVRAMLDERGLTATSLSGHSDLVDPEGFARHRRLLRICAELGIPIFNTFAGPERRRPEERASFVDAIRRIADEASAKGILICLENDGGEAGTAREVAGLLLEIDHPGVRMNYDAANSIFFGGADLDDDIPAALPWLGHVHLKDKSGGKDIVDFPPLGEGELDVPRILAAVASTEYDSPICLEIEFDGNWPNWQSCVEAVKRSRAYWDAAESS